MAFHPLSDDQVISPDFADLALEAFSARKPFIDYLQPLDRHKGAKENRRKEKRG
jgi:hypothetical protein